MCGGLSQKKTSKKNITNEGIIKNDIVIRRYIKDYYKRRYQKKDNITNKAQKKSL